MPNLKDIKTRIGSVKKTRQITSAMKLVSGAKLKRATDTATAAKPYQEKLAGVLQRVAASAGDDTENPLLEQRDTLGKVLIVVLTTDRGLCGGFNSIMLRRMLVWLDENYAGVDRDIVVYGRKGRDFCKSRKIAVVDHIIDYGKTDVMDLVRPLANRMVEGFVGGEYDRVVLVSNKFVNTMTQTPQFQQVLPLQVSADQGEATDTGMGDVDYEPGPEALLGSLLPLYLRTLVLQSFLETNAGEQAARMTAMDNATRNASDLIDSLTLDYNRARQAAITTELVEIVAGAEAL